MFFRRPYALSRLFLRLEPQERLDLAHEIEGRNQRFLARTPLGGADLIGMSVNVLSRFNLAKKLRGIAADAAVMMFHDDDLAGGVDHKRATFRKTFLLNQNIEVAGDLASLVAKHRELHLANGGGRFMPSLVRKVSVRRNGVDLNAQFLEFSIVVGEVFELSRAHEGEVGRVEEDDGPMALQIRIRNLLEGAFVVSLGFERQ